MAIAIREDELRVIHAHARCEYPRECCGILTRPATGGAATPHPCANIQEGLHQADPCRFPRGARTAYLIDPRDQLEVLGRAERSGLTVAGFYHSHVDCEACFSEEDQRRAMSLGDGPDFPEAAYLVVSVREGDVAGQRCFAWDRHRGAFGEVELEVIA